MTPEKCYLVYAICKDEKVNLRVFTDLRRANSYVYWRKLQNNEIGMRIETLDFSFGSERGQDY